ncbi:MAG: hypothetical protein KA154_17925 [Gemmatimonadaceae bacterium]|nr:hypothetical protein [Gemmatimonadaceae bacterium]
MSLLEWFFESRNPGPVGTIDDGGPPPMIARSWVLYVRGLIGLALILAGSYFFVRQSENVWGSATVFALYLAVSFWFNPKPDYSNVGLAGGLIDHPFRWSDDMNRILTFMAVITWPGRFAVSGLRDAISQARGKRVIRLTRSSD